MTRIHGGLEPIEGFGKLRAEDTEAAFARLAGDAGRVREEFADDGEADFSYELAGVSRFRVNAFRQRGAVSVACRAIPFNVRTIEDLGLPPVIRDLADEQRGIILLTGTTGSGKSTTLAAMIDHINSSYAHHVITLEDPIEYLHRDKKSIINQREVGADTKSFARAMKRVLRQDPDVILVGEMRDSETVRAALAAAETGHLVMSTLHTIDAQETVNRVVDFFPPHEQTQVRAALSQSLRGVVSQRLVRRADTAGRRVVCEVMVNTGRTAEAIVDPANNPPLLDLIADGGYYKMQTFDQHLFDLVRDGVVSYEDACAVATNPQDLTVELRGAGLIG